MAGLSNLFISLCNGKIQADDIMMIAEKALSKSSKATAQELTTRIGKQSNTRMQLLRGGIYDDDLLRLKDSPSQFYTRIRNKIYSKIRAGKDLIYTSRENYKPKEFQEALFANTNGYRGTVESSWIYRSPIGLKKQLPIVDRISLNVYQDKDLIAKLDNYLLEHCPGAKYKCPGAGKIDWNQRHDTVTIYLTEKATPKIMQDIADLVKPHIRQNPNEIMLGNKITQGAYQVLEPTKESIKPLLIKAKMMNLEPEFYEWLGTPDFDTGAGLFVMQNGERVVQTSPGTVEALKRMLELFEKTLQ